MTKTDVLKYVATESEFAGAGNYPIDIEEIAVHFKMPVLDTIQILKQLMTDKAIRYYDVGGLSVCIE
jgi:hypothetical protein